MIIYLSSFRLEVLKRYRALFPDIRPNVLMSFALRNEDTKGFCKGHRRDIGGLILDSGVWTKNTALSNTDHITLGGYIAYLRIAAGHYDFYFNFDEDFNDDGFDVNYTNQLLIEEAGLNPVPVVHDIAGDEIPTYIDRGYRRVALGSRQIKSRKILEDVMGRFEGTGIMIHLFGHTKFDLLANAPIESCDTAMWVKHGGWGKIYWWNPHREGENKTDRIYMDEYTRWNDDDDYISFSTYEYRREFEEYLSDNFNFTYGDLIGSEGHVNKMLTNTHYFIQLERVVSAIHRKKGFDTEE